jgi:hypothetical protein
MPPGMDKTSNEKKEEAERRRDFGRRLQIAVRRAHDPLFTPLKSPTASVGDVVDRRLRHRPLP